MLVIVSFAVIFNLYIFFFNDTATTDIYTLSLHDALPISRELLCLGTQNLPRNDVAELAAWRDWTGPRLAPKESLGEAFSASVAWQCVLACDALQRAEFSAANVSVVGTN